MSVNRYKLCPTQLCIGHAFEITYLFIYHYSIFKVISGMLVRVLLNPDRLRSILQSNGFLVIDVLIRFSYGIGLTDHSYS